MREKLENDIIDRAKKRNDWEGKHLEKFYFIGTDFEYWTYNKHTLKSTLFGNTVSVKKPLPMQDVEIPSTVKEASKKGWKQLLLKHRLIPNGRSYVNPEKQGIYISRNVMKNVSGVIGSYPTSGFDFFPNPFAEDQINDPNFMNYL
ncbi:hypothetical protein AKJ52_03015 [candidate division MSBL1 archaeon SCGC-AAA382C18]|uniref:Uncharacterized protein n=1 Tax=candidate division MSBL1 archaeon SCGC-AAA382C18 TaxID=1698281 RepID=A0A133VH86_9EURY|nr:hypothetical protein AKJ52_03015 [candidate division MSBL1 archaeon SCGC-AAA382C18]